MNYAAIKKFDIANGPGVRVSLFVSGCRHHCPNCFNEEAWDFNYGAVFDEAVMEALLDSADSEHISGLSLLGGEPFEKENRGGLIELCRRFRKRFPDKTIWCYTGFVFDDELLNFKGEELAEIKTLLSLIDVCVDGRFVEAKKSLSLLFRGSSNQRIIDVKKSLTEGKTVLLEGKWERVPGSGDIEE